MSKESFIGEYPRGKESDYRNKNYADQDKILQELANEAEKASREMFDVEIADTWVHAKYPAKRGQYGYHPNPPKRLEDLRSIYLQRLSRVKELAAQLVLKATREGVVSSN